MSPFRFACAAGLIVLLGLAWAAAPGQGREKKRSAKAKPRAMDRPARTVRVEVLCLELTAKAGGEAGGGAGLLDLAELSGPARQVRARVRELQEKGALASVRAVELTGVEGRSTRTQVGKNAPYVTGVTSFGGFGGKGGPGGGAGPTARSLTYRNVGMSVQVRADVGADGQLTLDLRVEDARMRPAEGTALGADEKRAAIPATEFVTTTLESRLNVRSGHIVVAQSAAAWSKAGQARTVILVGASTGEAARKAGK